MNEWRANNLTLVEWDTRWNWGGKNDDANRLWYFPSFWYSRVNSDLLFAGSMRYLTFEKIRKFFYALQLSNVGGRFEIIHRPIRHPTYPSFPAAQRFFPWLTLHCCLLRRTITWTNIYIHLIFIFVTMPSSLNSKKMMMRNVSNRQHENWDVSHRAST